MRVVCTLSTEFIIHNSEFIIKTMDPNYDPQQIETKWQKRWADEKLFEAEAEPGRPKYYVLEMLPYPSGDIHMGHVRNYSIGDALARYMGMKGFNILHPIGWDAFGLPAENAAIKHQRHPSEFTFTYIDRMRGQLQRLGVSYDWRREIASCKPEYYRWNQWFFLKMYERGLAYRKKSRVNWCPQCETVLANEQVVEGCCWRHEETPVIERELEQWFLKTTAYAEQLLDDMKRTGALAGARADHAAELDREIRWARSWILPSPICGNRCASLPRAWTRFSAVPPCSWRPSIRWWKNCWRIPRSPRGCAKRWSGSSPPPFARAWKWTWPSSARTPALRRAIPTMGKRFPFGLPTSC